jgi:hypothetical protein
MMTLKNLKKSEEREDAVAACWWAKDSEGLLFPNQSSD